MHPPTLSPLRSRGCLIGGTVLLVLALVSCGGPGADRLGDLEAENARLRQQLVDATAVMPETSTTVMTTTSVAPTTSVTPPTTARVETTIPPAVSDDSATVVSVTDGDTLVVRVGGTEERLRLIGINAPESGECLSAEAAERLKQLVGGAQLDLRSDVSERDQYGRLLRYVYVGDVFVNEVLVRDGLAIARRYEPDTAKAGVLEAAGRAAKADGIGLWAVDACGPPAEGMLTIGHIRYDADGNDNDNLNDEWVEFTNQGSASLDLTGWAIKDESASHRYHFPAGFALGPGETVRLHTGCGTDTTAALYWCNKGSAVWNNSGDTVFVLDPNGNVVTSESYTG